MKRPTIMMALCLGLTGFSAQAKESTSELVYIGTRGAVPTAQASAQAQSTSSPQGIYAARLDTKTGALTPLGLQIEITRVSWLLAHPAKPLLYVLVNPQGSTTVESIIHSYAVDTGTGKLKEINQVSSGGRDTTHLAIDVKSNTLVGASFASGEASTSPIGADGSVGSRASSQKDYGTGPLPEQNGPHAHSVTIDPTRRYVIAADIGADRIFVDRYDSATRALSAAATPFEQAPPGSGPRHQVFHPSGKFLYVNTEMGAEVLVYRWDANAGRLHLVQDQPAYTLDYAGKEEKSSGEIGVSSDGRFLYVSLRGDQDSIVVYSVNKNTGTLKEIQRINSQGKRPRSFGIDATGRWLLVTNEVSNTVNVFGIDKATGKLSPTSASISIPSPASVVFYAD